MLLLGPVPAVERLRLSAFAAVAKAIMILWHASIVDRYLPGRAVPPDGSSAPARIGSRLVPMELRAQRARCLHVGGSVYHVALGVSAVVNLCTFTYTAAYRIPPNGPLPLSTKRCCCRSRSKFWLLSTST